VIVYDASNSMWGQIEGEAKVTIARRVLGDIIGDWDASAPLGLVAYGHRREGDCSDIETLVPVGPVDREALLDQVEAISPKGKTPLTAAVRHAAEALKYRDAPANVVLISNGIESCNADPCAVASELNQAGINFTAHVIGFDVGDADQAQLQCIAENTGGRFFAARDAAGLKASLDEAAEMATEKIPEAQVTLSAPASAVAGSEVRVSWQGDKIQPRDLVTIVPADAEANAYDDYERVENRASATLLAPGEVGAYEARYVSSATGQAVARAPVELTEPQVTVSAPESVAGGASFTVQWQNAVHPRDYVTVVAADAPADAYDDYFRVGDNASDTLQAPSGTGDYEVRYMLIASGEAVARAPIEVVEKSVSVSASETVTGGANFTVEWSDAVHHRDYVTVVPADAPADAYDDYIRVGDARSGLLQAPADAGDYEVRYLLQESGRAIASAPLRVTGQDVGVSAPASVTAGTEFTVEWTDAVHHRDYITVVKQGAASDAYGDYIRVGDGRSGTLPAPAEPGQYAVRYLLQESDRAIASAPLEVTAAETSVSAPETAVAGSTVTVSWTHTIHHRDYVTIVEAGAASDAYGDYERVGDGNDASLPVPAEPGEYEVRYLLNKSDRALASAPLRVTAPETSISAPETAVGGSSVTVSWTNIIHPRDYVTVVKADAAPDAYNDYKRVGNGREARLQVPGKPGAYEVRYLLDKSDQPLATAPLTVTAPEVGVSGPAEAVAGSRVTVRWDNAVHPRDYVTIVSADAAPDAYRDYIRVGNGRDGSVEAPAAPGAYEIRYLLNVNDAPIARAPITLTAPEVSVSAPDSVQAGTRFDVSWSGTVHPRDMVTIVKADAGDEAYGDYLRVGNGTSGSLDAPEEPGNYEVRYLLRVSGKAIARTAVTVVE